MDGATTPMLDIMMHFDDTVSIKRLILPMSAGRPLFYFVDKPVDVPPSRAPYTHWYLTDAGWRLTRPKRFHSIFEAYAFYVIAKEEGITENYSRALPP